MSEHCSEGFLTTYIYVKLIFPNILISFMRVGIYNGGQKKSFDFLLKLDRDCLQNQNDISIICCKDLNPKI